MEAEWGRGADRRCGSGELRTSRRWDPEARGSPLGEGRNSGSHQGGLQKWGWESWTGKGVHSWLHWKAAPLCPHWEATQKRQGPEARAAGGVVLVKVWLKGADIQPELRTAPRKSQDLKGGMRESADRILDFSAHSSHFEHIVPHRSPHFLL